MATGRGRLSSFDLLPVECEAIVSRHENHLLKG